MTNTGITDALNAEFADLAFSEFRGQTRVVVPVDRLFDVLKALKEKSGLICWST